MRLLYLSADNLRSTPFIKDLVFHYKGVGKSILLHDHFGGIADTRFVTKRISSLLSEEMVMNNSFSGDQRGIFQAEGATLTVRKAFLEMALETVDVLVMNALGLKAGATAPLEPLAVAQALRAAFGSGEVVLFAKNSRSPLVASPCHLSDASEPERMLKVYEEEALLLGNAARLLPVVLASPANIVHALV